MKLTIYDLENTIVLFFEAFPVSKSTHTNTITLHLRSISWSNTTLSSTNLKFSTVSFIDTITNLMEIEDNVSTVRNIKSIPLDKIYNTYLSLTGT